MKWNKLATIFLLLPFALAPVMAMYDFKINASETLTLFLSLVWGILIALGGGLFFLGSVDYTKQLKHKRFMETVSLNLKSVSVAILLHTIIFVLLSFAYPVRSYLLGFANEEFLLKFRVVSLYESLLYVEIVIPALASVIVAVWCVLILMNQKQN